MSNSSCCTVRGKVHRIVVLILFAATAAPPTLAQIKQSPPSRSALCKREISLDMIQQQIGQTRTFSDSVQRVTVLIRAAEVLWPHEQKKARETFTEAFQVATQLEKENDPKRPKAEILILQVADQRYVVLRAVARKDSAWAKELASQILKTSDSEATSTASPAENAVHATRILLAANNLIATDFNAALDLGRVSLNYSASAFLTFFLYRVAVSSQQAADQLYAEALTRYADKPLREMLYLQAYPFAWSSMQNTASSTFHEPPANFVPNKALQRQLVQIMVRRTQQALVTPLDPGDN
jgi:hypothetical protein